jgi:hypothetical protein
MSLEAFEGAKMTAPVFKEQLKRVFHIKLTAAELAALMRHFDQDCDGTLLTKTVTETVTELANKTAVTSEYISCCCTFSTACYIVEHTSTAFTEDC